MRAALLITMFACAAVFADCAAVFAEDPSCLEDDTLALALDCPMLDIRIQGGLTEIQPEVYTWDKCGACEKISQDIFSL